LELASPFEHGSRPGLGPEHNLASGLVLSIKESVGRSSAHRIKERRSKARTEMLLLTRKLPILKPPRTVFLNLLGFKYQKDKIFRPLSWSENFYGPQKHQIDAHFA